MYDNLGDCRYDSDPEFRKFKRQLYHVSISAILQPLQPGMTTPVIRRCPDGHYRQVIYDLVAFIADYPEQVMLTGIVQGGAQSKLRPSLDKRLDTDTEIGVLPHQVIPAEHQNHGRAG
jgi:Plavaka transposase